MACMTVLAVVFVHRQLTFATPLMPTKYWRLRNFTFPMGTKACASFAYFGGFSHSQIAEMLGLPAGTVKGRMRLGLTKLRVQLQANVGMVT